MYPLKTCPYLCGFTSSRTKLGNSIHPASCCASFIQQLCFFPVVHISSLCSTNFLWFLSTEFSHFDHSAVFSGLIQFLVPSPFAAENLFCTILYVQRCVCTHTKSANSSPSMPLKGHMIVWKFVQHRLYRISAVAVVCGSSGKGGGR